MEVWEKETEGPSLSRVIPHPSFVFNWEGNGKNRHFYICELERVAN